MFVRTRKPWGWELGIDVPHVLQVKLLRYNRNARTSLQYHERKSELLIPLLRGRGSRFVVDGRSRILPQFIRHGAIHRVTGPAFALEFSTYHPTDVVRLADDYRR